MDDKLKQPDKIIEKVVTGPVKSRKVSEIRKFADIFIARDIDSIKSYIFSDVLIPAIKKAVSDIVGNGIDMLLYGETGVTKKSNSTNASRVSYKNYYDRATPDSTQQRVRAGGYSYEDVIFENAGDALEVLDSLKELILKYGVASVSDVYDLAGVPDKNWTSNNYGWSDVSTAVPMRLRDNSGYIIKFPKPMPLK